VLVNHNATTTVRKQDVLYHVGWSPLEGRTFPARIDATWVNGELAYHEGKVNPRPLGQRINFS
jgi:dihydroorotase